MAQGKTATGGKGCREKMAAVENGYGKKTAKGVLTWRRERQLQVERVAERKRLQ